MNLRAPQTSSFGADAGKRVYKAVGFEMGDAEGGPAPTEPKVKEDVGGALAAGPVENGNRGQFSVSKIRRNYETYKGRSL